MASDHCRLELRHIWLDMARAAYEMGQRVAMGLIDKSDALRGMREMATYCATCATYTNGHDLGFEYISLPELLRDSLNAGKRRIEWTAKYELYYD